MSSGEPVLHDKKLQHPANRFWASILHGNLMKSNPRAGGILRLPASVRFQHQTWTKALTLSSPPSNSSSGSTRLWIQKECYKANLPTLTMLGPTSKGMPRSMLPETCRWFLVHVEGCMFPSPYRLELSANVHALVCLWTYENTQEVSRVLSANKPEFSSGKPQTLAWEVIFVLRLGPVRQS